MKAAIYRGGRTDNRNIFAQFIRFTSAVIGRSGIPRLRFGTGSATSLPSVIAGSPALSAMSAGRRGNLVEGDGIAAHLSGARNDNLINQPITKMKLIRASN
jgi:hypothetical protein